MDFENKVATWAIIFDCDGVLVDSERLASSVERECLAEIGLVYGLADYQTRFFGLADADFYGELERDYRALGKGELPAEFPTLVKSRCWERFEKELVAIDGIYPFLDELDGEIAVASSSDIASLHRKLKLTGLHQRFSPHIYSGEQVAHGKPAADLFLFAASQLCQAPEDCLVIEDSANGVRAARSAGMEVWGFTGGGHADAALGQRLRQTGAHEVFSSYSELNSEIQKRRRM